MQGEGRPGDSSDERALQELERLQRSIEEYRLRRQKAEGEFEAFVGSFRRPDAAAAAAAALTGETVPASVAPGMAPQDGAPVEPRPAPVDRGVGHAALTDPTAGGAAGISGPAPAPPVGDQALAPFPERFPAELPTPPARRGGLFADDPAAAAPAGPEPALWHEPPPTRRRLPLILGAAAVLLIAAVVVTRFRAPSANPAEPPPVVVDAPAEPVPAPSQSQPAAQNGAVPGAAVGESTAPAAGAPAQTPGGAAAGSPEGQAPAAQTPSAVPGGSTANATAAPFAEIRTTRRAWVRVLVDGRREIERELDANVQVPLPAGTTFVIRSGDAGAVHFFLKGKDTGPLGADAQVVTRTFTP